MPRHVPVLIAVASLAACVADAAFAQTSKRTPTPVLQQASMASGTIRGLVRDDLGHAIVGVSVVAIGTTLGGARSDATGHFVLALAPGEYVIRATREGYVSTYREAIRIQTSSQLERNITLVRQDLSPPRVMLASAGVPSAIGRGVTFAPDDDTIPHDEAAWRMRHLPRTALRDVSPTTGPDDAGANTRTFAPHASVLGWAAGASLSGQFNFVTLSSMTASSGWLPTALPRGIASFSLSAPFGARGDVTVRGATTAADLSSWVVLAEYRSRAIRQHDITVGVSHGEQVYATPVAAASIGGADGSRTVGGLSIADRWRWGSRITLDSAVRLDRYDYVSGPALVSARSGARMALVSGFVVTGLAAQASVAPGAEEFLPPPSTGLWLPPERTFATIVPAAPFTAERVREYAVGVERAIGAAAAAPVMGIRRIHQTVDDQIATLFGLGDAGDARHYDVATPGGVDVSGWAVRVSGRLARSVSGSVEDSASDARWTAGPDALALRTLVPFVARGDRERLRDITTVIDAVVPGARTRVSMIYRMSSASSLDAERSPIAAGRFSVELHQALPFQPVHGGTLELLIAMRNLYRDIRQPGSLYDELLTVAPPLRVMGGVQVKF